MSDTLLLIQASSGLGRHDFPTSPHVRVVGPEGRKMPTSTFLYERLRAAISSSIPSADVAPFVPRGAHIKVLCNDPAVAEGVPAEDILPHHHLKAGTAVCDYLSVRPHIHKVVRLLGTHTLTDPDLIFRTLGRFGELSGDVRQTKKLGPDVCEFGHNIEVMMSVAIFTHRESSKKAGAAQLANFEEHVTMGMPVETPWRLVDDAALAEMKATEFAPQIGLFPGFVEERSSQNVQAILNEGLKTGSLSFNDVWNHWKALSLSMGKWKGEWNMEGVNPKTFSEMRELVAKGLKSVAPADAVVPAT